MEFIVVLIVLLSLILAILFFYKKSASSEEEYSSSSNAISNDTLLPKVQIPWEISTLNSREIQLSTQYDALLLTEELKNYVGEIIKLSPSALDLIQTEKKFLIKFNKDVMEKISSGELSMMKKSGSLNEFRTIAVDNKHKIRANGWIETKNVKKINPAQLANVAFGVMTIVTSQEHLDRINKQLNTMDKKIDSLLRKYNNDKFGFINGSIRYLKSILPSLVVQNHLSDVYLVKIEDISSEAYIQLESVLLELNTLITEISKFKNTKFKIDGNIENVKNLYLNFEEQLLIGYGNLELISICLNLIHDSGTIDQVSHNKLSDIDDFYKKLNNLNSLFEDSISTKTFVYSPRIIPPLPYFSTT